MSFQAVRKQLIFALADGYFSDEEFLILYESFQSTNPMYPYWEYNKFCLDDLDSAECKTEFRVEKEDIPFLARVIGVQDTSRCPQGTICSGVEGLCLLLKRLAYPCRYYDMI